MRVRSILWGTCLSIAVSGCASTSKLERELGKLRREVRQLREQVEDDQREVEKLRDRLTLVAAGGSGPSNSKREQGEVDLQSDDEISRARRSGVPELPVIKLPAEGGGEELGAFDDGAAPIMIKLGPDGGAPDRLTVDHDVLDKPDPVLGAVASDKANKSKREAMNEEYAKALATLRQGKDYPAARRLLLAFSKKYPGSHLADNAAYWLGECSFGEGNFSRAAGEFQKVLEEHPSSAKAAYAMLGLARSWAKLGKVEEAAEMVRKLETAYPESEAAKRAADELGFLQG